MASTTLTKRILGAQAEHEALLAALHDTQWAGDALRQSSADLAAAKSMLHAHDARVRRLASDRTARAALLDRAERVSVKHLVGRIRSLSAAASSPPPPSPPEIAAADAHPDDAAYMLLLQHERNLHAERAPLLADVVSAQSLVAEHSEAVHAHAHLLRALDALHDTIFVPATATRDRSSESRPRARTTGTPPPARSHLEAQAAVEEEVSALLGRASTKLAAALRMHAIALEDETWDDASATDDCVVSAARKVARAQELQGAVEIGASNLSDYAQDTLGDSARLLGVHAAIEATMQRAHARREALAAQTQIAGHKGLEASAALRALRIEVFEYVVAAERGPRQRNSMPRQLETLPEYDEPRSSEENSPPAYG